MTLYNMLENGNQSSVTEIRSVVIWSLGEGMIMLQRGTSKILVLMYVLLSWLYFNFRVKYLCP